MIVQKIFKRITMACCVEEQKNYKSFNEILEDLENKESAETLPGRDM